MHSFQIKSSFFCVLTCMREEIINHLTMNRLRSEGFSAPCNQEIRVAFILAHKDYEKLTEKEIQEILNKINEEKK